MNDVLTDTVAALCQEVDLPTPAPEAPGRFRVEIDGISLTWLQLPERHTALVAVLGHAPALAETRRQSPAELLAECLTLSAARLSRLAAPESLTLEPDTGDLVLWRRFSGGLRSVSEGLSAAESMLNEATFWRQWLGLN